MYRKSITLHKMYSLKETRAILGLSEGNHLSRVSYPELYQDGEAVATTKGNRRLVSGSSLATRIVLGHCKRVSAIRKRSDGNRIEVVVNA